MPVPEPISAAIEAAGGSLGFAAFQALALYDPRIGFYATEGQAGGRRGDFITSVEVGPLFGAVIAHALDTWWDEQGRPERFVVVEAAAGVGTLARTIAAAQPACAAALDLHLVEISAGLRDQHPNGVTSHPDLPDLAAHVVLANELLDNLPVELYQRAGGGWAEVRVENRGDRLAERLSPVPPTDVVELEAALRVGDIGAPVPDGQRLPLPAVAEHWLARAVSLLGPGGRLVAIDYFRPLAELNGLEQGEWLRTYQGHERGGHPLDQVGRQDITSDVRLPIGPPGLVTETQAEFLRRHGIDALVDEGRQLWTENAARPNLAAIRGRSRITEAEALLDPDGLGGFIVAQWQT